MTYRKRKLSKSTQNEMEKQYKAALRSTIGFCVGELKKWQADLEHQTMCFDDLEAHSRIYGNRIAGFQNQLANMEAMVEPEKAAERAERRREEVEAFVAEELEKPAPTETEPLKDAGMH